MSDPIPSVPDSYIDRVFEKISEMTIELDNDPIELGPKRLNNKVAEARGHLSDCESLFIEVSRLLQKFKSAHRTLQTEFEINKKHLFANDPEVRSLPHVTDREALATMKLRDQVREMEAVARNIPDLEALITIIKAKRSDLKDLQSRLRDQIKLCQEEIGLGSKWGSKPPPGTKTPDLDKNPKTPRQTVKDLRNLFEGSGLPGITDSNTVAPTSEPEPDLEPAGKIPEEFLGSGKDEDLDSFMESVDVYGSNTKPNSPSKSKIDDILSDLELDF